MKIKKLDRAGSDNFTPPTSCLPRTGDKRGRKSTPSPMPDILMMGASARLYRVSALAEECHIALKTAGRLLERLGVPTRRIGDAYYFHLYMLERAVWIWFGGQDDPKAIQRIGKLYEGLSRSTLRWWLRRLYLNREVGHAMRKMLNEEEFRRLSKPFP